MRTFAALLSAVATLMVVHAQAAAAGREREPFPVAEEDDPTSLASPDYDGYRPAWANPYAEPPEIGVNDDPTPFDPGDVDSGPSPLDPDEY